MFGQSLLSGAFGSSTLDPGLNFDTKLYTGTSSNLSIGGKINGAGDFNGSSSTINFGDLDVFSPSVNPLSFSLWIKTTNTTDFIFSKGASSSYEYGLLVNASGQIELLAYNLSASSNVSINTSSAYNDNAWHHVVAIYDPSGNFKIYVDGSQQATSSTSLTMGNSSNALMFGKKFDTSSDFYGGSMDQLRIYDSVLSASNITALYNETAATASTLNFPVGAGCIAAYTLDNYGNTILSTEKLSTCDFPSGASCEALYEFNGNGNDTCGTHNATVKNTTFDVGLFNKAAIFNGSTSEIEYPTLGTVFQNNYSISAWFRLEAYTSSGNPGYDLATVVSTFSDYYGWVAVNSVTNKLKYYTEYLNAPPWGYGIESTTTINLNQWYHMAVTKSSTGGMKLYLNGVLENTESAATQDLYNTASNSYKSAWGSYGEVANSYSMFTGQIDQGRIFNSVLTQAQVTELSRGEPKYNGASNDVNYPGFLNFQPDFTWIKNTGGSYNHALYDSVRGAEKPLSSNTSAVQDSDVGDTYGLKSFDSYGYTLGYNGAMTNSSGNNFVSWNWKAGNEMWALDLNVGTSTGYVDVPNGVGALGNATSDLSFSCWFRIPDASIQSFIICSYVNPYYSKININTETNGTLRANFGNGTSAEASIYTTSNGWCDGNWHHLAYTMEWNSGSSYFDIKFYKDGSLDSSHTTSGTTVAMSGNGFTFGGVQNTTAGTTNPYSTAQIGQARLYNSVLSSAQVTELHDQKATKYDTLDFPTGAGCVAAYNFKGNPNDLSGAYNGQGNNDLLRQIGKDTVNTDGSITSTVSANQDAGFSIINYTGVQPGSGNVSTIGHGLKKSPELIITKVLNSTNGWPTLYYKGTDKFCMRLNQINASDANNLALMYGNGTNAVAPTSSVYTVGNSDETNYAYKYIAYAWHSVAKYSKIGSYVGNRPTTVTITTDFEPGWVLIKDTANSEGWVLIDNKRGDQLLEAQSAASNTSYNSVQFTSTGFTVGDSGLVNTSGATIIYMAFAK